MARSHPSRYFNAIAAAVATSVLLWVCIFGLKVLVHMSPDDFTISNIFSGFLIFIGFGLYIGFWPALTGAVLLTTVVHIFFDRFANRNWFWWACSGAAIGFLVLLGFDLARHSGQLHKIHLEAALGMGGLSGFVAAIAFRLAFLRQATTVPLVASSSARND